MSRPGQPGQPGRPAGPRDMVLGALLAEAAMAGIWQLPGLIASAAAELGLNEASVYLADLRQSALVPWVATGADAPPALLAVEPLPVEATVAGRAFQLQLEQVHDAEQPGRVRVWVPLTDGGERVGVLTGVVDRSAAPRLGDDDDDDGDGDGDGVDGDDLTRLAMLAATLIVSKSRYGDQVARTRRQAQMGLAAELQWSLLPPLSFTGGQVEIAAALEPAYQVAGDTVDYAVDAGVVRAGLLDGMGHGLRSSQLAAIGVAAYRNARRAGLTLSGTAAAVDAALIEAFDTTVFSTGVFVELDTTTGDLSWVNAGHPPPLLLRDHHVVKTLDSPPHTPLGLKIPGYTPPLFLPRHERLEPGDRVVLFSDGVIEARAPDGEFFGESRLIDLVTRNAAAGLPATETLRRIVDALLGHQQGHLTDDATVLLLEWRHP